MKILAFSDLHRDKRAAQAILEHSHDADVLVGAGDFGTRSEGEADTLDMLGTNDKPCIIVHGNHDNPAEIKRLCERHDYLIYLHGTGVEIEGVNFFGLGGEIPSRNSFPWNTAETEDEASNMLRELPDNAVLVTHTPPLGLADLQKTGEHEGSQAIKDIIESKAPRFVLCGHIHHSWGTKEVSGQTIVQNLGPSVNWFEYMA